MANNFPNLRPSMNLDFVNGVYVDPRITFTRAGGRTFFGREMVKAEENLLIRSQEFETASWTKFNATVSENTIAAPDGTTTADTLVSNSANTGHNISQTISAVSGSTYTISVRAKKGTINYVSLAIINSSLSTAFIGAAFDLDSGAVSSSNASGTGFSVTSTSIVDLTGGWYLCALTGVFGSAGASPRAVVALNNDGTTPNNESGGRVFTGTGVESIYIWEAKLEQRSFLVPAVVTTTTQPITRYQRLLKTAAANEWPREFDPVTGECLGRSVWESRTNLLQRSEEFNDAYWTKQQGGDGVAPVVTPNATIAPDGTLTADRVDFTRGTAAAGNFSLITSGTNSVTAIPYSGTIFIKAATPSEIGKNLVFRHVSAGPFLVVTLTAEWQRVGRVETGLAGSRSLEFGISGTTVSGTSVSAFIWGAQLEAGAFATPYIPTVASQVTRLADSAVMTGVNFSSWFNPEQGCLFIDAVSVNAGSSTATITALGSADANNRITIVSRTSGASGFYSTGIANGATQAEFTGTHAASNKVAVSYAFNDYKGCLNGGTVSTDTTALVPVMTNLSIGSTVGTVFSGYYKRLTYYPQAPTAANLQAITR